MRRGGNSSGRCRGLPESQSATGSGTSGRAGDIGSSLRGSEGVDILADADNGASVSSTTRYLVGWVGHVRGSCFGRRAELKRPREVGVRLLKVPEVAALLRTGRKAVYAMIERGQTACWQC